MATPLKELYSTAFYQQFCSIADGIIPGFSKKKFLQQIFSDDWQEKELKDRMRYTTLVLRDFMPDEFRKTAPLLGKIIRRLQQEQLQHLALPYMFIPDYIEQYGLDDFTTSVSLFETTTPFTSCEFAVRPFIQKYGDTMLETMTAWSLHKNHHVRRLASEGSRPRLPWAMALPGLKKNPEPTIPILQNLKNDPSEYVRRSVANHLNDISKDHPSLVYSIAKKWIGKTPETDALLKHACRTMLKQGDQTVLKLFGHAKHEDINVKELKVATPLVRVPEHLQFSFSVVNGDRKPHKIRIEYAIHYLRQNGTYSKKIFKLAERMIAPKDIIQLTRNHSFRIITTRTFYAGTQKLSVIVNGSESTLISFRLDTE